MSHDDTFYMLKLRNLDRKDKGTYKIEVGDGKKPSVDTLKKHEHDITEPDDDRYHHRFTLAVINACKEDAGRYTLQVGRNYDIFEVFFSMASKTFSFSTFSLIFFTLLFLNSLIYRCFLLI